MFKNEYSVEITTSGGYTVTADDATLAGSGSAAMVCLENATDVKIPTATGSTIIPFHAVDHAIVTLTRTTVADPADPTCV
jgi:hypothetical protein